jgi:hypothetical protein
VPLRVQRTELFWPGISEVNVGHALTVVLEHNVTVFGVTDERAPIARGIIPHGAKLLELFQWDDRRHSTLIEPQLFEISEGTTRVHRSGVTCARVNIRVVGGKNAPYSFRLLLNEPVAIVCREQVVFLAAAFDV